MKTAFWLLLSSFFTLLACGRSTGAGTTLVDDHVVAYGHCGRDLTYVVISDIPFPGTDDDPSSIRIEKDCSSAQALLLRNNRKLSIEFDGKATLSIDGKGFDVGRGGVICIVEDSGELDFVQVDVPGLKKAFERRHFDYPKVLGRVASRKSVTEVLDAYPR